MTLNKEIKPNQIYSSYYASHILEFIKMGGKDMDFQEHATAYFALILHQSLNQFYMIVSLVIAQEAPNNRNKAVPSFFFLLILKEFCELHDLLFSTKTLPSNVYVFT